MIRAAAAALVAVPVLCCAAAGATQEGPFALEAGEVRSHRLTVPPGHVRSVLIGARFHALTVVVGAPDGTRSTVPFLSDSWLVPLVLGAGEYTLEVTSGSGGSYELRADTARPEEASDRAGLEAQAAWFDGMRLAEASDAQSRREVLERLARAASLFAEAGDVKGIAATRQLEAWVHRQQGDFGQAVVSEREVVRGWHETGETRAEAAALMRLGDVLAFIGSYEESVEQLARSVELWRGLADSHGEGLALYERSLMLFGLGRYEEVLATAREAEQLLEAAEDWRFRGEVTNLLARSHAVMGNVDEALRLHGGALEAFRVRDDLLGQAQTESYLARLQTALGEDAPAWAHAERGLALARRAKNVHWEGFAHMAMSQSARGLGRFEAARENAQAARQIWRGVNVQWAQAWALAEIGATHAAQREHRRALQLFDSALAVHRSLGDEPRLAQTLEYAGRSWLALGHAERALELLEEARRIWLRLGNGWKEVTVVAALAQARSDRGDLPQARLLLEGAIARLESLRGGIPGDVPRGAYLASVRSAYDLQMRVLWLLHQASPGKGHDAEALAVSERARARSLLDLLSEKRMDVRKGIAPELRRRERELHTRIAAIQRQIAAASSMPQGAARRPGLEAQLAETEAQRGALERDIRRLHPRYAGLSYEQPARPEQLRALLDPEAALLEYALGSEQSHLFVLTRERQSWYRLPSSSRIEELVGRLRGTLARPAQLRGAYLLDAREAYRLLVAPAEADLRGKRHLILVPDGSLHELPFDSLLTSAPRSAGYAGLPYLIRRWSTSVAPSGSVLLELLREPAGGRVEGAPILVAFGDPTASAAAGQAPRAVADLVRSMVADGGEAALPGLPGAREEVASIARLFPSSRVAVRLGPQATEEAVKTAPEIRGARYLHFATHALVSARAPQLSGLVMASQASPLEDGLLQVYEIFNLELSSDMVVLSACETGLGRALRGEGIVGLSRAFLYAGARTLVTSLWTVTDSSTADLMVAFYTGLASADKAESLRAAKLGIIASGRFAHPHHWSAFVLQGAWR